MPALGSASSGGLGFFPDRGQTRAGVQHFLGCIRAQEFRNALDEFACLGFRRDMKPASATSRGRRGSASAAMSTRLCQSTSGKR